MTDSQWNAFCHPHELWGELQAWTILQLPTWEWVTFMLLVGTVGYLIGRKTR